MTTDTAKDPRDTAMHLGRLVGLNRRNGNHDTAGLIAGQTFPELLGRHPSAMTATLVTDFLDEYDRARDAAAPVAADPDGCDGCDGSGAILGMDTPEGIQRCDECSKLPGDFEAAHLIASAYPGAVVMFHGSDGQTRRAADHTGALAVPDAVTIESETNPWVVLADGLVLSAADPEPGRNT